MLSDKEKKEMLKDGLSLKRRKEFSSAGRAGAQGPRSLDGFIGYLNSVAKIFGSGEGIKKTFAGGSNKL
ncbi:MAG: hypothetical protein AABZ57_06920 [Candidatus Margulisiibacteriota bacterium]